MRGATDALSAHHEAKGPDHLSADRSRDVEPGWKIGGAQRHGPWSGGELHHDHAAAVQDVDSATHIGSRDHHLFVDRIVDECIGLRNRGIPWPVLSTQSKVTSSVVMPQAPLSQVHWSTETPGV
jgi:hypothetical protein